MYRAVEHLNSRLKKQTSLKHISDAVKRTVSDGKVVVVETFRPGLHTSYKTLSVPALDVFDHVFQLLFGVHVKGLPWFHCRQLYICGIEFLLHHLLKDGER